MALPPPERPEFPGLQDDQSPWWATFAQTMNGTAAIPAGPTAPVQTTPDWRKSTYGSIARPPDVIRPALDRC